MCSSSESEDDCYGDVARKLENLKNKYYDDKFESVDLLDDSAELVLTTCNLDRDFQEHVTGDAVKTFSETDVSKKEVARVESLFSATKRISRSSRSKAGAAEVVADLCDSSATIKRSGVSRGRGRKKKSPNKNGTRGRRAPPVYCLGDTEEYPDSSQNLKLFTKTNDDVVLGEDNNIFEQNEELSVKVCWRSTEYCCFKIRKHQTLSSIFRHFAGKGNVTEDRLLFIYNDRILKPDDTPDSIQYNIAKFIEGGVVSHDVPNLHNNQPGNQHRKHRKGTGIQIKFQCQNVRKPIEITIQPNENLSMAMIKCAEKLEQPLNKLKFLFDGYTITGSMTANQLELEGGECIDVKLM